MAEPGPQVTRLLRAWRAGQREALDQLLPLLEGELRRIARRERRGERTGHSLQTTALVNEAYLRLVDAGAVTLADRAHFLGLAARMMRRILVDHARRRLAAKRGGEAERVSLAEELTAAAGRGLGPEELLSVHLALARLESLDPRQAEVVELRCFGGLTNDEVAACLGISRSTVKREWESARAWLHRELGPAAGA